MQTIAASMGVALENGRLFDETQRLFKAEQQRAAELEVINSIQQGVAAEMHFQAIVDLVGDKLCEVLGTRDIGIRWFDYAERSVHYLYEFEHGKRLTIPSEPRPPESWQRMTRRRTHRLRSTAVEVSADGIIPGTSPALSSVTVPIIGSDRVLGEIIVESYEREHAFGESDIRLLGTVASRMGVALENGRLFDETQRMFKAEQQRVAELAIINSVQQGVAAELNFQGIIDLVGDKLRQVFDTQDMGIRWFDEESGLIQYLYEYEHGERLTVAPRPPGIVWARMVANRAPVVFGTNEEMHAAGLVPIPGTDDSKSFIAVPIIASDRLIAVISLENYQREHAFGESAIRLIQTVASSMGVGLENARLFDETQRLLKETEQRNAELAIINSVQAALAAELNIQGIYDAVGDKIREIFGNTDMGIRIFDAKARMVQYPYVYESGQRLQIDPMPLMDAGFEGHVYRTHEALVVNERMQEAVAKVGSILISDTAMPKSAVYVPLVVGDQVRGMIDLSNYERERAVSDSDVRLLTTLANSMSVALENARLFDETQRLFKAEQQRVAE